MHNMNRSDVAIIAKKLTKNTQKYTVFRPERGGFLIYFKKFFYVDGFCYTF